MIKGVDAEGVPWFDDLYLDIVVTPAGAAHLLDAEELEEALRQGQVSRDDCALAWAEARRLLTAIAAGDFPLLFYSAAHRRHLLAALAGAPDPAAIRAP